MRTVISIGSQAPPFELPASGGQSIRLSDFRGKKTIVIYFYPRDDSTGCTIESCAFRDAYEDFLGAGAEVIGVSIDDLASHDRFKTKHRLPFILATDPDQTTARAFGVEDGMFGLIRGRATFVIDREGVVRDAFSSSLRFKAHVERALELVKRLEMKP